MSRFEELTAVVDRYQKLAAENYDRIRMLAGEVRQGLCDFIAAPDGTCVQLVPPAGPFEPRGYGDQAFSLPPRGFRTLGPISFGLAVRVSKQQDWLRLALTCRKFGEDFIVAIEDGQEYTFTLPLTSGQTKPFFEHIYQHILHWFSDNIEAYTQGDDSGRTMGFDFAEREAEKA
jgi:hypothetical protein